MVLKKNYLINERGFLSYFWQFFLGIALITSCSESELETFIQTNSDGINVEMLQILQKGSFETDAFITEWAVPATTTIVLPLDSTYSYNFIVDWGDDSDLSQVVAYNDPNARHTYIRSGTYRIRILGTCEAWRWPSLPINSTDCREFLTKVIQWGNVRTKSLDQAFTNCTALASIPADIPNVASFNSTFYKCESLTTLPDRLFSKCINATTFSATFSGCTALRVIPQNLFDACTAVTNFGNTFYSTDLVYIPEGLFDHCPNVTGFFNTFGNCKNITTIPAGLFDKNENVTSFAQTFYSCDNLKTIPLNLFDKCKDAKIFISTFHGCFNLTGETPKTNGIELWDRAGLIGYPASISGSLCFKGCTKLTNYDSIPTKWK